MEELLETLEHKPMKSVRGLALIDTCFFIDELQHHHNKEIRGLAMTSFNAKELMHVARRLPDDAKKNIRNFLHRRALLIVDIPVEPGNMQEEKEFVNNIDPELLKIIADPSDAVLLAVALKTSSVVLTKDKRHLFTVALENYAQKNSVRIFKEFKDYELWTQGR